MYICTVHFRQEKKKKNHQYNNIYVSIYLYRSGTLAYFTENNNMIIICACIEKNAYSAIWMNSRRSFLTFFFYFFASIKSAYSTSAARLCCNVRENNMRAGYTRKLFIFNNTIIIFRNLYNRIASWTHLHVVYLWKYILPFSELFEISFRRFCSIFRNVYVLYLFARGILLGSKFIEPSPGADPAPKNAGLRWNFIGVIKGT